MLVSVSNPVFDTVIIGILLIAPILGSFKHKTFQDGLSPVVTTELKGLAILMVVFSHIGYFLVSDHRFLFPLSACAGVGVNLFLFLSGYGFTVGGIKKGVSILGFYSKRIIKLFIPLWVVLGVFLILDGLMLHITYPLQTMFLSFCGIFLRADIYKDINSPLWYFTFNLFFTLLFPLFFIKKYPWLTALLLAGGTWAITRLNPGVLQDVMGLYKVHIFAFPLGIFSAWVVSKYAHLVNARLNLLSRIGKRILSVVLTVICIAIIMYTTFHSGVGEAAWKEQIVSLVAMSACIGLFVVKRYSIRFLSLIGLYSYEIYLLHWPLLYRYNPFYSFLSPALATVISLGGVFLFSWFLQVGIKKFHK